MAISTARLREVALSTITVPRMAVAPSSKSHHREYLQRSTISAAADGGLALAGLLQATDGNLYGTTWNGGANSVGTVFRITTDGTFSLLHSFTSTEGGASEGALLQAPDGSLYGMTGQGGTDNYGTIFRLAFPLQFVPVTPCRVLDTRQTGNPIQGGTMSNFTIPQLGECGIPSGAGCVFAQPDRGAAWALGILDRVGDGRESAERFDDELIRRTH